MDKSQQLKEFGRELTGLQRQLYRYVVSLVGNPTDADDVLQESNRVIWEKSHEFTPGTDLRAWAFRIARFEVMTWRKRQQRERLRFGEELLDLMADEAAEAIAAAGPRRAALRSCLKKLRAADLEMITRRYMDEAAVREMASASGRSQQSVYQSLARIRHNLMECILREMAAEEQL